MIKDFLHIFYPQTYKLANGKEVKESETFLKKLGFGTQIEIKNKMKSLE